MGTNKDLMTADKQRQTFILVFLLSKLHKFLFQIKHFKWYIDRTLSVFASYFEVLDISKN